VDAASAEPQPNVVASRAPLHGLRVIEVSSFVAAPLGGMTLAQLGADVIRVDPRGGAADRYRWPLAPSGASLYWAGLNKGKRSITVDFSHESGRDVIRDLVRTSPERSAVVLTNAVGRKWLSYDALVDIVPDLIHVQVEGKRDGSPAVDYTVNAELGFPLITGPHGFADPVNHVLPAWDLACGLYAALGVTAAALRRNETGEGESIHVALGDVALATAGNLGFLAEAQLTGVDRKRIGNHLYGGFARDFECADGGRLMLVALTDRQWRELILVSQTGDAVSALEKVLDADFTLETERYEHREVLAALLSRWFARRTLAEASEKLEATSVLWAPYRSFAEVSREISGTPGHSLFSTVEQPGIGSYSAPGSPLRLASGETSAQPAPLLGHDTAELLQLAGRSDDEIARMAAAGIVGEGAYA